MQPKGTKLSITPQAPMNCSHLSDAEMAERYVAGMLTEAESTAFEDHFFACGVCLADLQALQAVQDALARETMAAATASKARPYRRSLWVSLAAAAVLLIAVAVWSRRAEEAPAQSASAAAPAQDGAPPAEAPRSSPPSPQVAADEASRPTVAPAPGAPPTRALLLAQLAVIVPPRYIPLATRGSSDPTGNAFESAMRHYAAGRYGPAARGLQAVAREGAEMSDVRFFLGISELMEGRTRQGRDVLERVAASGAQPYADEAHFYLAKAALKDGDTARARRELENAVARNAGPDGEAARILARLR